MSRSRRSLAIFLAAQFVLIAVAAVVWSSATSAQDAREQNLRSPIVKMDKLYPSDPSGFSPTVGTLPPRKAGFGYISLPTSAWQAADSNYVFTNYGKNIFNLSDPPEIQVWSADILLPEGAVVTQLVLVGGDNKPDPVGSRDGSLALSATRSRIDQLNQTSQQDLLIVTSQPNTALSTDMGVYSATLNLNDSAAVAIATVDNSLYAYQLVLAIPPNANAAGWPSVAPDTIFRGARIEYAMPANLSLPRIQR
jgi:hypothetical protein